LLNALRHADPADKAEVYRELGVCLTYDHAERTVLAETRPTSSVCVVFVSEGGLAHYPPASLSTLPRDVELFVAWQTSLRRSGGRSALTCWFVLIVS
jgi:hypothetical protein